MALFFPIGLQGRDDLEQALPGDLDPCLLELGSAFRLHQRAEYEQRDQVQQCPAGPDAGSHQRALKNIIMVDPPALPLASFEAAPTSGMGPLAVRFDDTSTGLIASYAWNFGDGSGAAGMLADHTYAAPGRYLASLTITTDAGQVDTTEVGIFFTPQGAESVSVDISSLSSSAKMRVADFLFAELDAAGEPRRCFGIVTAHDDRLPCRARDARGREAVVVAPSQRDHRTGLRGGEGVVAAEGVGHHLGCMRPGAVQRVALDRVAAWVLERVGS